METEYDLIPEGELIAPEPGTSEYRLTHFRVYDENGYAGSFATGAPEGATLESVSADLCARFAGEGGTGFGSKDLVVLLGARIVAVVLRGPDGRPEVTTFEDGAVVGFGGKEWTGVEA
jgi:hypothetical protein